MTVKLLTTLTVKEKKRRVNKENDTSNKIKCDINLIVYIIYIPQLPKNRKKSKHEKCHSETFKTSNDNLTFFSGIPYQNFV